MRTFKVFGALLASAALASIANAQESDDQAAPQEQRAQDNDRGDRPGRPNREELRRRMLERFDADGDGQLSGQEREKARQEMRNRRDRGEGRRRGDGPPREPGRLGPGAPPHGPGVPPNPMRLFNAFDEDKNEQLSKQEFEKLMIKLRELAPPPGGPRFRGDSDPDGPRDHRRRREGAGRPDRPRRPQAEPSEAPAEATAKETAVDATT